MITKEAWRRIDDVPPRFDESLHSGESLSARFVIWDSNDDGSRLDPKSDSAYVTIEGKRHDVSVENLEDGTHVTIEIPLDSVDLPQAWTLICTKGQTSRSYATGVLSNASPLIRSPRK